MHIPKQVEWELACITENMELVAYLIEQCDDDMITH